jgi:hypothetical protein
MAHRFLVCPPSRRAIPHPISPWATHIAGGDAPKACRQWERFIEILTCAGDVRIVAVDADVDAPDLTFTGSAALINGNLAILSTARDPARRDQQAIVRATLARAGLATTSLHHVEFRGASDTLFDRVRPCCYAGYHSRADRNSITELTDFIGCRVLPLLLVDDRARVCVQRGRGGLRARPSRGEPRVTFATERRGLSRVQHRARRVSRGRRRREGSRPPARRRARRSVVVPARGGQFQGVTVTWMAPS